MRPQLLSDYVNISRDARADFEASRFREAQIAANIANQFWLEMTAEEQDAARERLAASPHHA